MAVMVIGLMTSAQAALSSAPATLLVWLGAAFAANFGLQIAAGTVLSRLRAQPVRTAYAIAAGNRNIALFLVALPREVTDPLLLFIGCYQVPMYLTPILLGRFYRPS